MHTVKRQPTHQIFLKNGGFKVHHFDRTNITSIRSIVQSHRNLSQEQAQPNGDDRNSHVDSLSQPQFSDKISDFCDQDQQPEPSGQKSKREGQKLTPSKVKQSIKRLIQNGIPSGRSQMKLEMHEQLRRARQQRRINSIRRQQFQETVKKIIHNVKRQVGVDRSELTGDRKFMKREQRELEGSQVRVIQGAQGRIVTRRSVTEGVVEVQEATNGFVDSQGWEGCDVPSLRKGSKKMRFNPKLTRSSAKIVTCTQFQRPLQLSQPLQINETKKERIIKKKKSKLIDRERPRKALNNRKLAFVCESSDQSSPQISDNFLPSKLQKTDTYSLHKVQKLIIESLPSRNPSTTHNHNSIASQSISLSKPLKDKSLYFASQIARYSKEEKTFIPNCTPRHLDFIAQTLKTSNICRQIPQHQSDAKRVKLKRNFHYQNKKILLLDLDQTLVHSQPLNVQANKAIFPYSFQFDKTTRHFAVRRHARQFLKAMSESFYIAVFTSSVQGYADNIIQHLDPKEQYIQHRLYRCNCFLHDISFPYIKDLRTLNKDLSQVILVDNALYTYWFNIDNGIPIVPFTGTQDDELLHLQKYLLMLQNVDDVRKVNRRTFHMHLYKELDDPALIVGQYCRVLNAEIKGAGRKKQREKEGDCKMMGEDTPETVDSKKQSQVIEVLE